MEDAKIVDLFLSRDESAISHTAEKYGSKLRQIANHILNDISSAEECENDTYFEAWNRIPPHEPRTYLFAFLGRIARHIAIDVCRRNASQKRQALFCELTAEMEECVSDGNNVENEVEAKELSRTIGVFLDSCSEDQRNVFVRRYWFFDTIPEICARNGYSQSKVKSMLFRMREELRDHLKKGGYAL